MQYKSHPNPRNSYSSKNYESSLSRDPLLEDIPDYGSAFVCGKSRFEEGKFHVRDDPILQISCGDEHTGVVTEKGRVFMFGSNNWGQLGLGHENNVDKPSCVKSIKHEKVRLIACGRYHTLLATERGNLYSFGCNSDGQLGLGDDATKSFYSLPVKIESIDSDDWLMIAAGSSQSAALSRSGDIFVWGSNENGEIGLGKVNEQRYPKLISLDFPVAFVACGYYHTAIVSKKGRVYTCGSNENAQLGHNKDNRRFNEMEGLDEPIRVVSCGGHHTVLVSTNGNVYTLGDGTRGQLGNGEDIQKCKRPELVSFFKKKTVFMVSAGECQTAFVTDKREIFTCGDNRYGKLGLDQNKFNSVQFYPHLVDKYRQLNVMNVACGGCHMILIGKVKSNSFYNDDERSDEGFDERRNGDRRNRDSYSPRKGGSSRYSPSNSKEDSKRNRRRDSDSDFDEENERTFNRTHTLTRDHGFVPLSDLNLRKTAADDKLKSSSKNLRPLMNDRYSTSRSTQNRRPSNSDSDNSFNGRKSPDRENKMKIVPYVKPSGGTASSNVYDSGYSKTLAKFNVKTLSDDDSDYKPTSYSRSTAGNSQQQQRKVKNLSSSSDDDNTARLSSRSNQTRKNTKTLHSSSTNLRSTTKSTGPSGKSDDNNKPKEKPFKICTIL